MKYFKNFILVYSVLAIFASGQIKAETGSASTASSQSATSASSNSSSSAPAANSSPTGSSTTSNNTASSNTGSTKVASSNTVSAADVTTTGSNAGVSSNVQATSVQVEPSSGSATLSIPIQVPPGRAGIQPNLALAYDSNQRQLGNAGVGWTLDLGSIQISTKKGVPKYDGTDIFTIEQNGATQDLVADPNTAGLYHMEVEGSFANIQYYTTYWVITDKKGIKYYYGNTSDSKQVDPNNISHIFLWALNRVEDLNGNYMTISYLNDNGQIYPQIISYTGNDQSSLILSTYAQVTISYASTTNPVSSYISGFGVKIAKRIDHITVSVNSINQTLYTFTYKQSGFTQRDLLQSVQQKGSDGTTTLPAITFTYNDTTPISYQQDSAWNLSNLVPLNTTASNSQDAGVRFVDLNGDNYPDMISSFKSTSNNIAQTTTLINSKNKSFIQQSNWSLSNFDPIVTELYNSSLNVGSYDDGFRFADFNGDGVIDMMELRAGLTGYASLSPAQNVYNNDGSSSFSLDSSWSLPSGVYFSSVLQFSCIRISGGLVCKLPPNTQGTEFADVTGNGFPDLVQSVGGTQGVYLNQFPKGNKAFTLSSTYTLPTGAYTDFTNGAMLVDLNGDGLADIIYLKGGVCKVYMNTAYGWVETGDYENNAGLGDLTNLSTQFIDVNGDGLPDMVIANGSTNHVLINTGHGWAQDDRWAPVGGNFTDYSTQFLDANADGMQGYLVYPYNGSPQLYINKTQPADLLININNGVGGTTNITYGSSAHYQNTFMPFIEQVVTSVTTTDALSGNSYTSNYSYAGGLWDKNYREFDGFQTTIVRDPQGNYVTSIFLQDHWLKGHPSEQDTYDSNGNLYSKSVNTWQTQTIVTNTASNQFSKFLYVSRTDSYLYDGNNSATPKRTAQEFTYGENPQYGDVTQTINDGQVDPTSGTSIDPNKTTTNVSYVYNTNNWLIGLPAQTITQNTSGSTISKTSFYYDGDTTGSATPVLGRLTAKVNWLGSTTQADPRTTYSYDAYGNLHSTTDPNSDTTTITYDNTVHMFPEQTTNALNQTVTMTYYGIDSAPLNNGGLQGLWGQARSKTDANNQTAYTTYDVFGRPSTSISPLDSVALPTEQKTYNIQSSYIAVTDTARVSNGSSATISTVSYYDGLGRLIETKSLGPTVGQYIVSGQTVYDNRGLPITKYLPYFTSNNLNTLDAINTTKPSSQAAYDPMGRVITKTNPDGTYSSVTYNQWMTTTTDENGHKQQSIVDAFGRLVQKQEYTGADGRSSYYPSSAYTLYATTTYVYNPLGNLTSVTDAHNNVTTITYDNLGRKIAMNDPDMGNWHYCYDGNGNLIWQQDAKGQVISFTYDALNRLTNKTDGISGPIVNLPNIQPLAPTFNVNYNFDDHSQNFGIGRLGSVSYDSGTAGFVYDQLGREVSSNKNIAGVNYNVIRQYDALNRLQQLQYPEGSQENYTYNQSGQVTSISGQ